MPAACWSRLPGSRKIRGPLRAFSERVYARRGMQVAVVATARKLATLCWHLVVNEQDYAFARPLADRQEAPGAAATRRHAGPARAEGHGGRLLLKQVRRRERALSEQAEVAYRQLMAGWQPKRPATKPQQRPIDPFTLG
jgi:transposase